MQSQLVIPFEERCKRVDLADIHSSRFVNAHETLLTELLQEITQRSPDQVILIGSTNLHLVVICFQVVNAGTFDQAQSVADWNQQTFALSSLVAGYSNR